VRTLAARLGVRGTPTFVILDAEGNAIRRFPGPTSGLSLRKALDEALAS
jgi:thioredoxin-related protein